MSHLARLAIAFCLPVFVLAQLPPAEVEQRRETWNGVFERGQKANPNNPFPPNAFLQDVAGDLKPGRVLDAGMGQGRNSLWLAGKGWQVTGVDISDEGVSMAQEAAVERGVVIDGVVADLYEYDYGDERWDLVVSTYMHSTLIDNAEKVIASLKPGGLLLIEGFHRDHGGKSVQSGGRFGFKNNELLRVFNSLRVLRYEDLSAGADWAGGQEKPIIRFLARKPI